MAIFYRQDFGSAKTAKEILLNYPRTLGQSGYYFVYPNGRRSPGQLIYCDMSTDGGGYMLITRSHSTGTPATWGWLGGKEGNVQDFTQPYQAGWGTIWKDVATFTSYTFGNRNNVNDNSWGPFIYRVSNVNYSELMSNNVIQTYTNTVLASNTAVWNRAAYPPMQTVTGFPTSGLANSIYYMRDCCGYIDSLGARPNGFATYYINDATLWYYSGPWGAGSNVDISGNYVQTTGNTNYGGTKQYMIYVK